MSTRDPNDVYEFGHAYDILDTCDEALLGVAALGRDGLLDAKAESRCRQALQSVRREIEAGIERRRGKRRWWQRRP